MHGMSLESTHRSTFISTCFLILCNVYRQNQRSANNCEVLQQIHRDMIRIAREWVGTITYIMQRYRNENDGESKHKS